MQPPTPTRPHPMRQRTRSAQHDLALQQFVGSTTARKDADRRAAMHRDFGPRADAVRDLAGRIRQHTLDHLDTYLEQFIDTATAHGTQIHFARDAQQANAICASIAQRHNARLCVKSKSMVSEELKLNDALKRVGCEAVETDLGEFILQLDNDEPSHIVSPMIHKDRAAAGRAMHRALSVPYTDDPATLTRHARAHMRDQYARAQLGITGGNFLVADTGSLVLCTNEGNARFCTALPPVHVAVVGIEKLVPRMAELSVLLKLLARSGTGQPLTVYTNILAGPRRAHEPDGPEHMHIVLIDNARTRVLAQPRMRSMLGCIRCGACLNACPVYRKSGGHAYGSVYSGPIGAILTPMLKGLAPYHELPQASSLCGACYEACPVRIDIPKMLIELRRQRVQTKLTGRGERTLMRTWAWTMRHPRTYRAILRVMTIMLLMPTRLTRSPLNPNPYNRRRWLRRVPGLLGRWTAQRDLPTPTTRSFNHWWQTRPAPQNADPGPKLQATSTPDP